MKSFLNEGAVDQKNVKSLIETIKAENLKKEIRNRKYFFFMTLLLSITSIVLLE